MTISHRRRPDIARLLHTNYIFKHSTTGLVALTTKKMFTAAKLRAATQLINRKMSTQAFFSISNLFSPMFGVIK